MVNFYHRFIDHAAEVLAPLNEQLKTESRQIEWPKQARNSFDQIKHILASGTLLHHYQEGAILSISSDASATSVGAVLHQHVNGERQPLAFASNKLTLAQQNYPTFDRELLAVYFAIRQFRYLIEGRQFCIYTDHKPLTNIFSSSSCSRLNRSPRQLNHMSFIAEFTTDIRYVKGEENIVADCLSRFDVAAIEELTPQRLSKLQEEDGELKHLIEGSRTKRNNLKFDRIDSLLDSTTLVYELSSGRARCSIPLTVRRAIFKKVHNLSHPGIRPTLKMIIDRYF